MIFPKNHILDSLRCDRCMTCGFWGRAVCGLCACPRNKKISGNRYFHMGTYMRPLVPIRMEACRSCVRHTQSIALICSWLARELLVCRSRKYPFLKICAIYRLQQQTGVLHFLRSRVQPYRSHHNKDCTCMIWKKVFFEPMNLVTVLILKFL